MALPPGVRSALAECRDVPWWQSVSLAEVERVVLVVARHVEHAPPWRVRAPRREAAQAEVVGHQPRARTVGLRDDPPHERRGLQRGIDQQLLAGQKANPHRDGQFSETVETGVEVGDVRARRSHVSTLPRPQPCWAAVMPGEDPRQPV